MVHPHVPPKIVPYLRRLADGVELVVSFDMIHSKIAGIFTVPGMHNVTWLLVPTRKTRPKYKLKLITHARTFLIALTDAILRGSF